MMKMERQSDSLRYVKTQTYSLTRGKGNDDEDGKTVGQFKVC